MAAAAGAGAAARRLRTARNALPRRARCTLGGSDAPVGGRRAQLGALIAASAAAGLATPQRAALAAAGEFTKLPATGAVVERVTAGTGDVGAASASKDRVVFHYVLRRANGYFVYSTTDAYVGDNDADDEPEIATLGEGALLPGIEEALEGERAGAVFRVLVPPSAGYQTYPGLKPQVEGFGPKRQVEAHKPEPLVFEVRLLKVDKGSSS